MEAGDDAQAVAAGLALHPELLAGARVEGDEAAGEGALERFGIDEAEHKDVAVVGVLNDGGDEAVHFVEINIHSFSLKTKSPLIFSQRALDLVLLCFSLVADLR